MGEEALEKYVFTQQISEFLKISDFDGIIYTSSQGKGQNYAFFNPEDLEIKSSTMHQVVLTDVTLTPLSSTDTIFA